MGWRNCTLLGGLFCVVGGGSALATDLSNSITGSVSDGAASIPYRLFEPTGLADGQKAFEASAPLARPRFDQSPADRRPEGPRALKGLQLRKPGIERDMGRQGSAARARMRRARTLAYRKSSPRVAVRPTGGWLRTARTPPGRPAAVRSCSSAWCLSFVPG